MGEYVLAGISNDKANTKILGKIEGLKSLSFILPESFTFWCEIRTTKASACVLKDLAQAKPFLTIQEKIINDCTSSCEYSYAQHK